ncbi:hypothetical protein, partial [Klebsiella pneumoniae]|uniref:hypothetical protein n=1 Tax=Klebsiella pneumoniae TaxID=573 RepID=UPI001D0E22FC
FLLMRKQRKVKKLDTQINEIKATIEPSKDTPEFLTLSRELRNKLTKWDKESSNKKKEKFIRDTGDYARKEVFRWQS